MSTIWAFDLGKGSIGEAVWNVGKKQFDHVASLLIPAEFASTKDAASRRRMMRTRQAHKAREAWLDEVWKAAGFEPLVGRRVGKVDGKWQLIHEGDPRLEREFSAKGDSTCYTSCLLRIKLLRGEKLEPWQIYKALHSAIQKRGYGRVPWASREVRAKDLTDEALEALLAKQEQELAKKDPDYRAAIEAWSHYKDNHEAAYHYPCYYDAEKQGLWSQDEPETLSERIDHTAGSTRQVRFDRDDVEKEVAELARQAAKQLPKLADAFARWKKEGWSVHRKPPLKDKEFKLHAADIGEFLVHGPAGQPSANALKNFDEYLSFREEAGIHPGSADDWLGATAQKTPRFDNRIVNDCTLLDGMQVCKVEARLDKKTGVPYPDSLLPSEVTFLMKLKNIRIRDGDGQRPLIVEEINALLAWARKRSGEVKVVWKKEQTDDGEVDVAEPSKGWAEKIVKCYAVTEKAWGADKVLKKLDLHPLPGHEEVKAPKIEGRSRFSRSALKIIRALLLGGQKPSVFLSRLESGDAALLDEIGMDVLASDPVQKINGDKQKLQRARPYVLSSQLKFLRDLAQTNDTWEGIYLPEQRMDALEAKHKDADGQVNADKAIHELIGANNDPIVRHRLEVFDSRLVELQQRHGTPSEIVLEFVRTDFMGEDAKRDLAKFQKEREKTREESRSMMRDHEIDDRSAPLKYELLKQQGSVCLYCCEDKNLQNISMSDIAKDLVDIDHIVPRSKGGPDAMINYVLAHRSCNSKKNNRTPFEWLHSSDRWQGYLNIIGQHATLLRNKKVQLLTREDAPQLVERYTALAETAWISKLAKKIIDLRFGWQNSNDASGDKRVTVVSGGLTGRIRRKFKLNSILNPNAETEEEAEKKNRKDNRHHALDAMVISFLPSWMRDPKKEKFFRFPDPVGRNPHGFLANEIERVMPEVIAYERAALAATAYGSRWDDQRKKSEVIVQRTPVIGLAMQSVAQDKKEYNHDYLDKQIESVRDKVIRTDLRAFARNKPTQQEWECFCADYRKPRKDGSRGPRVVQVTVLVGLPNEYREMSKDGKGMWRKGAGNHQGQIIWRDADGAPQVLPVYAHASITTELRALKEGGGTILGFFQTGCMVETQNPVPAADYSMVIRNEKEQKRTVDAEADLPPCRLTLRNIVTKSMRVELTLADNTRVVGKIDVWIRAGLHRID